MKKNSENFHFTHVVTRDIINDIFQGFRNLFGLRLRKYEDMIQRHIKELIEEMELNYKEIEWYRISINPMVKGSVMITLYGQGIPYE